MPACRNRLAGLFFAHVRCFVGDPLSEPGLIPLMANRFMLLTLRSDSRNVPAIPTRGCEQLKGPGCSQATVKVLYQATDH